MDEDQVAQTETEQTEQVETAETTEREEDSTDWKALAEKREKAFEDQKKRAEKAERLLKERPTTPAQTEKSDDDLSSKDILALSTSGISDEDDIEFLQKAAKLNGTSIAQALKDSTISAILKGKQEERQTANASQTSSTRRMTTERSGEALLGETIKTGKFPESRADVRKLIRSKIGLDK